MSRPLKPTNGVGTLTTADAAKRLGVSLRTIQLWCADGLLRYGTTPGGHRRIAEDSVHGMARQMGVSPVVVVLTVGEDGALSLSEGALAAGRYAVGGAL